MELHRRIAQGFAATTSSFFVCLSVSDGCYDEGGTFLLEKKNRFNGGDLNPESSEKKNVFFSCLRKILFFWCNPRTWMPFIELRFNSLLNISCMYR